MVTKVFGAKRANQVPETDMVYCLCGDKVKRLPAGSNVHVIEGRAWITYGIVDVIAEEGETVALPSHRQPAIISSTNTRADICYQIVG